MTSNSTDELWSGWWWGHRLRQWILRGRRNWLPIRRIALASRRRLVRFLAVYRSRGLAIETWDLVDHVLIEPIGPQIILLLRRQFEYLSCSAHAVKDLLIRKPRTFHCRHFVHGDKAVAIEIGGGGTESFLRRRGVLLRPLHRRLGSRRIMTRQTVFVCPNEVTAACTDRTAKESSQQAVMLSAYRSAGGRAANPANRRPLGARRARQLVTAAGGQT